MLNHNEYWYDYGLAGWRSRKPATLADDLNIEQRHLIIIKQQ